MLIKSAKLALIIALFLPATALAAHPIGFWTPSGAYVSWDGQLLIPPPTIIIATSTPQNVHPSFEGSMPYQVWINTISPIMGGHLCSTLQNRDTCHTYGG